MTTKTLETLETLLRRRGFYIMSEILYEFPEGITHKQLRKELESHKSHYNSYLRVREMLLKIKLISYFLDSDNVKNVKLTEIGRQTWEKWNEIVRVVDAQ